MEKWIIKTILVTLIFCLQNFIWAQTQKKEKVLVNIRVLEAESNEVTPL